MGSERLVLIRSMSPVIKGCRDGRIPKRGVMFGEGIERMAVD